MILATALVLRSFVRTSDMEFILCLNLIQFNWGTHCFSSLLQHLPLVYSFKRSCKKYKKCKNTKMRENQKKIDSILIYFFALPLSSKRCRNYPSHESYEDVISQPQTSTPPPEAACNTIHCKAFLKSLQLFPPGAMPCQGREACEPLLPTELWWWELMLLEDDAGLLLGRGTRLNSTLVLQVGG